MYFSDMLRSDIMKAYSTDVKYVYSFPVRMNFSMNDYCYEKKEKCWNLKGK